MDSDRKGIALWRRGRRLFTTAAALMLLTATAHTAGNLASGLEDASEKQVFAAMDNVRSPLGFGMSPSLKDIYWELVFIMSITFAALAVINLLLAASNDISDRLLQRIAWANVLWVGACLILSWHYQIPPPLISTAVIEVFLIASVVSAKISPV